MMMMKQFSIRAIPVYTCSRCGYVSYTTPPDY